jgi:hypothetical protein
VNLQQNKQRNFQNLFANTTTLNKDSFSADLCEALVSANYFFIFHAYFNILVHIFMHI